MHHVTAPNDVRFGSRIAVGSFICWLLLGKGSGHDRAQAVLALQTASEDALQLLILFRIV
jgi:hypothetical protein